MTPHDKFSQPAGLPQAWHEELSRSTKYKEAAQKRTEEIKLHREKKAKEVRVKVEAKA